VLVEAWTEEIRGRARSLIGKIDELGGAVAAIERGWIQREIEESAYQAQRAIEEKRSIVVGVNAFSEEKSESLPVLTVDPAIERDQVDRLRAFRAKRDGRRSEEALSALVAAAREDRNLMPPLIAAVGAEASLGEIVSNLKAVYGEHHPG
jgi:methylmalonyl-CoA mutase N-terminal domain/subunit